MRRRDFIAIVSGAAAWPMVASAQPATTKIPRIGFIGLPSADSLPQRTAAFRAGLKQLGYHEGQDLIVEYRIANTTGCRRCLRK